MEGSVVQTVVTLAGNTATITNAPCRSVSAANTSCLSRAEFGSWHGDASLDRRYVRLVRRGWSLIGPIRSRRTRKPEHRYASKPEHHSECDPSREVTPCRRATGDGGPDECHESFGACRGIHAAHSMLAWKNLSIAVLLSDSIDERRNHTRLERKPVLGVPLETS